MVAEATQQELEAGRGYEKLFVPALFASWPRHVLDGAAVQGRAHVLDIACGSGVLARAAFERCGQTARVVGLDPAPGMIAAAKEVEPHIQWVVGIAENLPFDDGTFDHVISQFGIMFFQDRPKAVSEMYRVTKPGGKLAVAVWHSVDDNPAYKDIASVLEQYVSPDAADTVRIPFCLDDPLKVTQLFSQAGFDEVAFETKREKAEFPNTRTMVEVELRGWLPLFGIHLSEGKISEVLTKSDAVLAKYATSSGAAVFPTTAYVITANKPE